MESATTTSSQQQRQRLDVQLRWGIRRDMAEVMEIEQACFSDPWTEEEFLAELKMRDRIIIVAERGQQIVGYMIYVLTKHDLQLINFAVSPDFQRQGVGSQLIDKLKAKLSQQRRRKIIDHVRETNVPMQLFLRSQGFTCRAIERDAFENTDEDAYVFVFEGSH